MRSTCLWTVFLTFQLLMTDLTCRAERENNQTLGLDNRNYTRPDDWIKVSCLSDSFEFSQDNINKTNIFQYYANWTRVHRKEIELPQTDGSQDGMELRFVGENLFGKANFECSLLRGVCSPMPECEDIAEYMGLKDVAKQTDENKEEWRRRYFFANILHREMNYYHDLYEAINDAKPDILAALGDIVVNFATQAEETALKDCQNSIETRRDIITSLAFGISFIVGFIPFIGPVSGTIAEAGLPRAERVAVKVAEAREKVGWQIVGTTALVGGVWEIQRQGLLHTALPPFWYNSTIPTILDTGVCEDTMGDFQNQNSYVEMALAPQAGKLLDAVRSEMLKHVQKRFSASLYTPEGQSTMSAELEKFGWRLPLNYKDGLRDNLRELIKQHSIKTLVGTVLQSAQCYIKCLQLDPRTSSSPYAVDLTHVQNSTNIVGDQSNKLALSTFYPEYVLAGADSSTKSSELPKNVDPTLQCQFQCLTQNQLADSVFPDSIFKMANFKHARMDPHIMFTEAVTQALLKVQGFADDYSLSHQFPSFSLPVCISGVMVIDTEVVKADRHRNWWKWLVGIFKQEPPVTYFPFQCGDWKANETRHFLDSTPVSSAGENYKKLGKFYERNLGRSLVKFEAEPVTHFLALCGADHHVDFKKKEWKFRAGAHAACADIAAEVARMSEIEATFWLCEYRVQRDGLAIYKELCERLRRSSMPLGFPRATFKLLEANYIDQLKAWEDKKPATPLPKWDPIDKRPLSNKASPWPPWPPQLAHNLTQAIQGHYMQQSDSSSSDWFNF